MPKPAEGGRRHVLPGHGGASLGHATHHLSLDRPLELLLIQHLGILGRTA